MFHDTLAALFCNNTDEGPIHLKHPPRGSCAAWSHQELEDLLVAHL
jgi:hypothetical protein